MALKLEVLLKISGIENLWQKGIPHVLITRHQCPLCTSVEFEDAMPRPMDTVLRRVHLSPVRCVNCWRHYYWFGRPIRL